MNDTVTRLMNMSRELEEIAALCADPMASEDELGEYRTDLYKARQALHNELTRLFTPLSDAQIRRVAKVGPVYAPNGRVERDPWEYKSEIEGARAAGIRIAEQAHGITGARNEIA